VTVHGLLPGAPDAGLKSFAGGTHRVVDPEETVRRVRPLLPLFGITRVANVTGLDHLGIPVVVVCRPNSRSLSVSQGKGLTLAAARASGVMEAVESWHAERIVLPLKLASYSELRYDHDVVDGRTLPQVSVSRYDEHLRLLWIEGWDVLRAAPAWVPYELVHLNLTLPLPEGSGCFPISSNGLASGNHLLEAAVHALCEVIERDAYALWYHAAPGERAARRLDLASVDDPGCVELLARFEAGGMLVGVWELTSEIGVPAFRCTVITRETDPMRPLYPSSGLGCHPSRGVALFRALSEAAQSRLTRISSSRDDVPRADYELTRNPDLLARVRAELSLETPQRRFGDVPSNDAPALADDLAWLASRLRDADLDRAVIVDLTHPELGIPVVRAVIPGLEPKPGGSGYRPGPRARAVVERRVTP
jgi:YcaO-like protein with predicted kinase domain